MLKRGFLLSLALLSSCSTLSWNPEPNRKPEPVLSRGWSFVESQEDFLNQEASGPTISYSAPAIADEKLVFGSERFGITVLGKKSGQVLWQKLLKDGVSAQPLVNESQLFVGTDTGMLHLFDLNSGRSQWEVNLGGPVHGAMILAFNRLFAATADEAIHALDPGTGKVLWTYRRPAFASTSIRGGGNPAAIAGRIWVGFSDGALVSLNPDTGSVETEKQFRDNLKFSDLDAKIVGWKDGLLVATYDGKLRYIRRDGSINWEFPAGGSRAPLLTEGEVIYFPSSDGNIYALNANSGKEIWRHTMRRGVPTGLALATQGEKKALLVTGSEERVLVLDPGNGTLLANTGVGRGSGSFGSIALDKDMKSFYILSLFSRVHQFHLNL